MWKFRTESRIRNCVKTKSSFRRFLFGGLFLLQLTLGCFPVAVRGADEPGVIDRSKAAVKDAAAAAEKAAKDAKDSMQQASRTVGKSFENLWRRVSDSRLKNRTRDEMIAWAIMGILVGAVAGMMSPLKTSGLGKLGRLLPGLAGAFIGGMIVHFGRIDFGLGPVLIRYEELLFSLVGAVVILVVARLFRSRAKKKPAPK